MRKHTGKRIRKQNKRKIYLSVPTVHKNAICLSKIYKFNKVLQVKFKFISPFLCYNKMVNS